VIIPFKFFLGKQGICSHKPHFCHRHPEVGSSWQAMHLWPQMRKTENFRLGGNLGFCLLVAQPPYPLNRILQCWLRACGAGLVQVIIICIAIKYENLDGATAVSTQ
jgi:hypothetical protein